MSIFQKVRGYLKAASTALVGSFAVVGSAHAADLTGVTTAFGTLETDLATVGALILGAAVVAVTFKWLKGMLFS